MPRSMNRPGPQAVVDWLGWAGDDEPRHVQQRSETKTFLQFLESGSTHCQMQCNSRSARFQLEEQEADE